jgi:hypothetical protein
MSFFDKLLQTVLNEERLDGKGEVNEALVEALSKKIEEERKKLEFNKEKNKPQSAVKKVGFDFIFNTDSNEIDINNNDIVIVEDYINIDDIDVDSFIESHRLSNISADIDGMVGTPSPMSYIDKCISVLESKLNEDGDDGSVEYREKTREQKEKLKKLKRQNKKQLKSKQIIINVLIFFRHKKNLWGLITKGRNLTKEKGGCNRDYEMEEKVRAEQKAIKNKMALNRAHFISRLKNMRKSVGKILLLKKALRKLNKLLGKKVALRLLRVLAKNNKLNARNINSIIKKLTVIRKRIKAAKKNTTKAVKKIKSLERKSVGVEEEQKTKIKKETKKLEKVKEEAKVKEKENLEKIKDITKKKSLSRGLGM